MNKTRLEAFSDGVLAIIITIMVLEIKIPHSAEWNALAELVPTLMSYVLSFIFVGIYWGNHHHLLHTVHRVTSSIIWANIHLLFWLSLMPFATGWMGENHFAQNTVVVYGMLLLMNGVAFTILQVAIQKNNKMPPELENAFENVKKKGMLSMLFYMIAIAAAFYNTAISGALFVLVAVMWIVPDKHIERALEKE